MGKAFKYNVDLDSLIRFRRELHKHPTVSGKESETVKRIQEFMQQFKPDKVYQEIGGNSIAFGFFESGYKQTLLFRADMDALPISEELDVPHQSVNKGISHKCGHDGHSTILMGVASLLKQRKPNGIRVVLLFQAEEETGTGAEKVVNHPDYKKIRPDWVFGLHNLPGFPSKSIIIRNGTFAAASTGMIIKLRGRSTHAGQPEKGINPAQCIADLVDFINQEVIEYKLNDFHLVTIIHIRLGEVAFGTSPGYGTLLLTLRAFRDEDLDFLKKRVSGKVSEKARKYGLESEIGFTEEFPATQGSDKEVQLVRDTARDLDLSIEEPENSFRWSEDFGHYTRHSKGAFFGLGSGKDIPDLHNPDYDFPDEIIPSGINMFISILDKLETN